MRAKFVVETVSHFARGGTSVNLTPVMDGTQENKAFWEATPSGKLEMCITNPSAKVFFEAGAEYYIDFTRANEDTLVSSSTDAEDVLRKMELLDDRVKELEHFQHRIETDELERNDRGE